MGKSISEVLEEAAFYEHLKPYDAYHPYPACSNRDFWEKIHPDVKKRLIEDADRYLDFEWKNITPASYLHYFSKGDRTENEDQMFGKRTALGCLMLGECVKNDGSYLEAVVNGIFSVCEETTWAVAAHIDSCGHQEVDVIPAWDDEILDLFAMETAQLVAFAYYLLGKQLDGVSKRITQRMKKELHSRIIQPFLNHTDYWWMGYGERKMNNWTPWCTSNAIIAAALTEEDPAVRQAVVKKAIASLDQFVAEYPEDGSCDEGTSYWFKAGGRLIVALDILQGMCDTKLCIKEIEKLYNMSAFILNARIGGNYYLNFADASALIRQPDAYMIYRMGELLEEESFLQEGIRLFDRMEDKIVNNSWYSTWNVLNSIRYYERLKNGKASELEEKDIWYPQNQILMTSHNGRSFVIKGGHNAESHNHNDVGNYVFYIGEQPIFIDAGVGVYTKDTFSEKRYQIWTMQSQYHNLPMFDGVGQKNGADRRANQVHFRRDGDTDVICMHLEDAYPCEAGVEMFVRTAKIAPEQISICDTLHAKPGTALEEVLMCAQKPQIKDGGVQIGDQAVQIKADCPIEFAIDEIPLEDEKLHDVWGASIYRIRIALDSKDGCAEFTVRMNA